MRWRDLFKGHVYAFILRDRRDEGRILGVFSSEESALCFALEEGIAEERAIEEWIVDMPRAGPTRLGTETSA